MTKKAKVEVPLWQRDQVYQFQPLCVYCEEPAEEYWETTLKYDIKEWRMYRKTGQVLEERKEGETGKVTLKVPYCSIHLARQRRKASFDDAMATVLGGLAFILGAAWGFAFAWSHWEVSVDGIIGTLLGAGIVSSIGFVTVGIVGIVLEIGVMLLLSVFSPDWRGFPMPLFQTGSLGLFASVKSRSAGPGLPFTYTLVLLFSNSACAARCLPVHPAPQNS